MSKSPLTLERLADAVAAYAEWCGGVHDEGCPEDDTCSCSGGWINDGVNAAVNHLRAEAADAALVSRAPQQEQEIHRDCHDLVCNGSRHHPRGAKGIGCSCRYRDASAAAPLPASAALQALIEQWRGAADWMMGSTQPDEWQRGGSGYLRRCADELEAALSRADQP